MENRLSPDEEWEDALRIARIIARQRPPEPATKQRTPSKVKHQPHTMRLIPHSKRRRYVDNYVKDFVFNRDGGRCFYCYCDVPRNGGHFDHVVPVARGGNSSYANLVLSCVRCNESKGASILENLNDVLAEVRRRNREVLG
jgi:5-methylcytosine-specific restriction endonuclease McrA